MVLLLELSNIPSRSFSHPCTGIMIGLQSIAVRMSDPFGDDDTDFNVDGMLANAYNTAVELLVDERKCHEE